MISAFFEQNIIIVYFLYGLAFFSMGLAVWLESGRASELRLARTMGPLAAFGLLHGLHEWLEMFQRLGDAVPDAPAIAQTAAFNAFRVAVLTISFVMLIIFGVRLIHSSGKGRGSEQTFVLLSAGALLVVWLVSVVATQRVYRLCLADCLVSIDVLTRYILAIPGSILAAWAMILEQRAFRERGLVSFGKDLQWAAVALLLYGILGQGFPPRTVFFPANVVNSEVFWDLFGIPVQFFRAAMAAVMAIFIIRALRAFELEHRQRLAASREARLAAQQAALAVQRQAREETEQLNRELQVAVQDLTLLFELSRHLAGSLDREALLRTTIRQILENVPRIQAGMVLLCEGPAESPQVVISSGCEALAPAEGPRPSCQRLRRVGERVLESGHPALYQDGAIFLLEQVMESRGPYGQRLEGEAHIAGVALLMHEQVCGSLVVATRQGAPPLTGHDLSLLSAIAGQLAVAVEKAALYQEVQEREALRSELYHRIISAQERERQRIARELHDGTGQMLTGLGLGLKAVSESVSSDPELASRQLLELKDLNAQALQELRDLVGDLRPSVLDDLGLVPALQGQVQVFEERSGVCAALEVSGNRRRLEAEVETVIFRIGQEALTNVARHAAAAHVMVRLVFGDEMVQLVVTDDGRGFDPREAFDASGRQRRAWGLLGMQERVTLVGGTCEIVSQPGTGTTVFVQIPLHGDGNDRNETQTEGVANDV